jgi:hypothetical protein
VLRGETADEAEVAAEEGGVAGEEVVDEEGGHKPGEGIGRN